MTLLNDIQVWTTACAYDQLIPGRGVGVLLDDGSQAALFRLDDGSVRAVGNVDPFSGAAVLSRGDRRRSRRTGHGPITDSEAGFRAR
ncbi:rieske-like domain protein [Mycobacterium kansasii 824]|nr:rieske-like domain protein [Mycobacterium kansasii 824]